MGQFTIIREQDQPLTIHIETSDRKDAGRYINKLNHGWATVRIIYRRHKTNRLMEHQVGAAHWLAYRRTIEQNGIMFKIHTQTWFLNHSPIHRHTTRSNQRLAITAGSDAGTSENLL
jgi:hypothetical protein